VIGTSGWVMIDVWIRGTKQRSSERRTRTGMTSASLSVPDTKDSGRLCVVCAVNSFIWQRRRESVYITCNKVFDVEVFQHGCSRLRGSRQERMSSWQICSWSESRASHVAYVVDGGVWCLALYRINGPCRHAAPSLAALVAASPPCKQSSRRRVSVLSSTSSVQPVVTPSRPQQPRQDPLYWLTHTPKLHDRIGPLPRRTTTIYHPVI